MFSSLSKKLWEVIKSLRQDTSGGKYIKKRVAPRMCIFLHDSCKCSSTKGVIKPDQSLAAVLEQGKRQNCYRPSIVRSTGEPNYVKHL